jgi:hypothetical protein
MDATFDFQMVCGNCGCVGIKIEHPETAPREAAVHCSDCGDPRGTMGALRDLAARPVLITMDQAPSRVSDAAAGDERRSDLLFVQAV